MSNLATASQSEWTPAQLELIKSTVAKGASNDELKLFLYRCKHMGLDPLKPGQIHFIKYGNNPGSIVIGREGFRSKAASTKKHVGTKVGILRDESGQCIGAWAEVYRSDWTQPARDEVSLAEYNTGRAQWAKMPETMIKKVAEVAALRMAFPDELGGLYSDDEMAQAEPPPAEPGSGDLKSPGDFIYPYKSKGLEGRPLHEIDPARLADAVDWVKTQKKVVTDLDKEFVERAEAVIVMKQNGFSEPPPEGWDSAFDEATK